MSEIAASERRLRAALDRIDQMFEAGSSGTKASSGHETKAALGAALEEIDRLNGEIAALSRPGSEEAASERLTEAGEQAARLAAANEDLSAANRALINAVAAQGDADSITVIREALEAEIESLRAARAAEIAHLGDIMAGLERLLPEPHHSAAPAPETPEIAGDDAGVPEAEAGGDKGIYTDTTEEDDETGAGDR